MRNRHLQKRAIWILSAAAVASFAASALAWVNPLEHRYLSGKPLEICDQGSFFVGGVPKITPYAGSSTAGAPQQIIIGQMYVQFEIPKTRRKWPLVMVHGSSHTGAALEATPDGREGWFPYAVRKNLATFVVDQPGRGRSGFDSTVVQEGKGTGNLDLIPGNWGRISDTAAWTFWFGHVIPAGTDVVTGTMIRHGDPGDPDPAEDVANPSHAHGNYPPAYPIPPIPNSTDPNLVARVGAIGPAPNAANHSYLGLEYYKQLVPNAEITLPGSVCPTCVPTAVAPANTWSPRALAELVERLDGAILAGHSQATDQVMHTVRILKERGKLHLLKGIIIPEGRDTNLAAAGLTGSDFDRIPFLIVNTDFRALATRTLNRNDVAAMNASPTRSVGPALAVDMDSARFQGRFNGQTHMNMLDTTNLALFDFFLEWAGANIPNPVVANRCASDRKETKAVRPRPASTR